MRALLSGVAAVGMFLAVAAPYTIPRASNGVPAAPSTAATTVEAPLPERPRATVDTTEIAATGRTIHVPADGNLQAAIDQASLGDRITLEPAATYRGPFRLPRKEGAGWLVITSATPAPKISAPGQHINPSQAARLPKLIASSGSVIIAEPSAHHYRLVGLEIAPADGVFLRALVQLGADESSIDDLPHHIIIDRCYLHGDPRRGTRRGVAMNSRDSAVIHSYLSDFKEVGADSQAIAGWNGTGPVKIADNYLEAAGENVMFGGADPAIQGLVPADIEVVRNHMAKPLAWKSGAPAYEGVEWAIKNLFELKNARRVLIDGNLFEYNWPHAQNGFAILFTVRNQDGGAPWSVVEDVTFVNNVVRHVASGINILGRDDIHSSQPTRRIAILNNLFVDVGGQWGRGRLFQLLDGTSDVRIEHNTALQTDSIVWAGDGPPHTRFVFQNNIALHNEYGIIGSSTAPGKPTLDRYFPGAVVRRNVIVGGRPDAYPPDNFFPKSLDQVGFIGPHGGNYRLAASSSFKRAATDGRDLGANLETVAGMIASAPGTDARRTARPRAAVSRQR
ncbi:MAG: hypothetical protein HY655_15040 [Acidobacteria bacterium]|nr:hypothetical protein [Acidobacteriota bacterium]